MSAGQPGSAPPAELDAFLDSIARLGGVVSSAEALVASPEGILYRRASGYRVGGERLTPGARFDVASLTKPWMATLAVALDLGGLLSLSTPLGELFELPEGKAKARTRGVLLSELLRHSSGIAAWAPLGPRLGRKLADRSAIESFLLSECFSLTGDESAAGPAASVYSDLGYILWGLAVERRSERKLSQLLDEVVCSTLGVAPLGVFAAAPPGPVECRLDNGKEVELAAAQGVTLAPQRSFHLGIPQDGNSRALGFLAGHAGLFATADEMLALGREWLRPAAVLTAAARDRALSGTGPYAMGWVRWSEDGSSGPALSRSSFGHTGFTGGSLWIDPEQERIYVLLAHRLASRIDFNPVRREFHRLAAALP